MPRTALQLYSLREVDRPLADIVEAVADAGYDGVEFAYRLADADHDAVRAALDRTDTAAASAHVPIDRLEDDRDGTVDRYRDLGCETLVVPYLPGDAFATREAVAGAADRLTALGEALADTGVGFGYHNHDHEFVTLDDDRTAYDELAAATGDVVDLQIDVGLAALAGRDPVALLERYADRLGSVHLKDYDLDAERSADLGDGDVPIGECVEVALAVDVEWFVVEFEDADDPLASAQHSLDALRELRDDI